MPKLIVLNRQTLQRALPLAAAAVVVVACLIGGVAWRRHHIALEQQLVSLPPETVVKRTDLVRFAASEAKPVFARECAPCHGADMKGRLASGSPNLTDGHWLFGDSLYHIERTIMYGVRSGHERASGTLSEMRAFGQRGLLTEDEIRAVVQYLLQLNGRPNDHNAAEMGRQLYAGKGLCYDCHAADAKGNSDYGAPDLTDNVWQYGGTPQALYDSIYYGRHGVMPIWRNKLTLTQIRALAVYVHATAHKA